MEIIATMVMQRFASLRVLTLFASYADVHSVLASFSAKRLARWIAGERAEKGLLVHSPKQASASP